MAWQYDYELTEDGGCTLCEYMELHHRKLAHEAFLHRMEWRDKWRRSKSAEENDYCAALNMTWHGIQLENEAIAERWKVRGVTTYSAIPF